MKKLLIMFAAAMMLFGVQNANAIGYTVLAGSNYGQGEGPAKLFDGTTNTKWGTHDDDPYVIFKSSLPIKATSYKLVIANDTNGSPGRNWKKWEIYAGSFSNEAEATRNAAGWVLIDSKEETLPTGPFEEVSLTLSNADANNFYSYYKIEVKELAGGWNQYCQMDEFSFTGYTTDTSAYDGEINSAKNFDTSKADALLQNEYAELVGTLDALRENATATGDFDELDAALLNIKKLQEYINAYNTNTYVILSTAGATWGDGAAANLLDGKPGTKWGGDFTSGNIVWRLKEAILPLYYQLTAAGDTGNNPERNWKSWAIYGANFDKILNATESAEGWVELYSTEDGGMTTESGETQDFDFTNTITENYQYFKVVLKSNTSGGQSQMADLNIIDGQAFQNKKAAAVQALQDFQSKYDYSEATAEQQNAFEAAVAAVGNSNYKNLTENVKAAWAAEKAMADYLASDEKFGAESVNISSGLDADVFTRNIPAVGDVDIIEGFDNNQTGFYTKTVTNTADGSTQTTNFGVPDDGILKTSTGHTYAFDYDNYNAVYITKGQTKTMTIDGDRQSKSWRFYFLGTASNGPADMTATFNYADGTTSQAQFQIYNWDTNNEVTRAVTVYQTGRVYYNGSLYDNNNNFRFYEIPAFVDQNKVIKSISLYNSGETKANSKAMVFGFCIVGKDDSAEMFYMGSNGYATYVPEVKDIDMSGFASDGLAAYTVSFAPEGWANLTKVTKIPVGSAVVMKGNAGSYKLPYTTGAAALTGNDLKAATADVTADGTQYVLADGAEGIGFYLVEAGSTIAAGKGYLEIPAGNGVKGFYGFEAGDATGISDIDANVDANAVIYNLSGQRIQKAQKGINIVNGKKILK
ncbi:MAG: hypothetical protein UHJ41_03710 [Bacteroidaceae bacterium]|nr:hypothetical protein [Bacteroidaceae bacterium]